MFLLPMGKFIFVNICLFTLGKSHLCTRYVCNVCMYSGLRLYLCRFMLLNVYIYLRGIPAFIVVYQCFMDINVLSCRFYGWILAYVYIHLRIRTVWGVISCSSSCLYGLFVKLYVWLFA